MYCNEVDDVEHTLFQCPRWELTRTSTNIDVGIKMTPDNIISVMLTSRERWHSVEVFMKQIMKGKEVDEKR